MHLPNVLTVLRILLTPVICWGLCWGNASGLYLSTGAFLFAALTDFADGYVAEKYNARSVLGAALDPLADKILIILVLFFLGATGRLSGPWMFWPCALIIAREILVMGLRSVIGAEHLPVIGMAKAKTFLQMISVGLLIHSGAHNSVVSAIGLIFLWTSAVLSASSAYVYLKQALKMYRLQNHFLSTPVPDTEPTQPPKECP